VSSILNSYHCSFSISLEHVCLTSW
jgi:hypothetical protein